MINRRPLRRKSSSSATITRSAILLLILIIAIIITQYIGTRGLPGQFSELFSQGEPGLTKGKYVSVSARESERITISLADFWYARFESAVGPGTVTIDDRIEFQKSGIIWRVSKFVHTAPDRDTLRYMWCSDAYLRPFGWRAGLDSVMACDVRVLRQMRIIGADTCFGPENLDVVWELGPGLGSLAIRRTPYESYTGSLTDFFPSGVVRLMDDTYSGKSIAKQSQAYKVGESRTISIDRSAAPITLELTRCPAHTRTFSSAVSHQWFATQLHRTAADSSTLDSIARNVYAPLMSVAMWELDWNAAPGQRFDFALDVTITPEGVVEQASLRTVPSLEREVSNGLVAVAKSWRFPVRSSGGPLQLSIAFPVTSMSVALTKQVN